MANGNGNALSPPGAVSPAGAGNGVPQGGMASVAARMSQGGRGQAGPMPVGPGSGTGVRPGGPPGSPAGMAAAMGVGGPRLGPFAQAHENARQAAEQYKTNMKAHDVIDSLRQELDDLMEKGDMIRPEDVIQAMGRLMGHESGVFGAEDTAQFLADMPTMGGQSLATWIRLHDVQIRQVEMRLARDTDFKQHRMAVTGIKSLAASTLQQESAERQRAGLPGIPMPPQAGGGMGAGAGMGMGMTPQMGMGMGGGNALAPAAEGQEDSGG